MNQPQKPDIATTADGSVTLYRNDIDEHYHSTKGALAESLHIYIDLGWRHFSNEHSAVRVFEIGFGTGLNAALTAHAAAESLITTEYIAVELYPVATDIAMTLERHQQPELAKDFHQVNAARWNVTEVINPYFTLRKIHDNLLTMQLPEGIDVVYFDAFSPEKQPEMWSADIFQRLYDSMTPGGVLTTYCAKGSIRRLLQSVGFVTERLAGPRQGKREVLRATKTSFPNIY